MEAQDELHDPGGEADAPGDPESDPQGPRGGSNDDRGDTNAPGRATGPGGHLELQGESRGAEVDWERRKVVERAEYDRIRPSSDGNSRGVDANTLCRDKAPGGDPGERNDSGEVEDDRERQSDGNGDHRGWRRGDKDGATSAARRDSKRVETDALAGYQTDQHNQRQRTARNVPGPSTPPPDDHRRPTYHPNPPRHRGRLKTRPRQVSQTRARRPLTHFERSRRGRIGQPRSDEDTP
jgi:hypothetical protein